MILGIEQSFVLGFLLTAMPAFTGGAPCSRMELLVAVSSVLCVDAFTLAGLVPAAVVSWLIGLGAVVVTLGRRVIQAPSRPPVEFLFVPFGLGLGLLGGVLMLGGALGWWSEPRPRFGIRLASLGFVLSLVLGLGARLVPTFSEMRRPLEIPWLAGAQERGPRLAIYLPLLLLFGAAFVAEALGQAQLGAVLRAAAAAVMLLMAWKIWRLPGRREIPAWTLWTSGWMTLAGLLIAAAWPHRALAGEHVVFIGGFGLLTLGVGTRVVVSHGGHALAREAQTLGAPVAIGVLAALAFRVIAEISPARLVAWLGASGALWGLAWALWGVRAIGLITGRPANHLRRPPPPPREPPPRDPPPRDELEPP